MKYEGEMTTAKQKQQSPHRAGFLGVFRRLSETARNQYVVHPAGFEPTTPAFGGQYSIQLSYGCLCGRHHTHVDLGRPCWSLVVHA